MSNISDKIIRICLWLRAWFLRRMGRSVGDAKSQALLRTKLIIALALSPWRKIFAGFSLLAIVSILVTGGHLGPSKIEITKASDPPTVTWNGGGTDELCAGGVGSGNWWSCTSNWSTGIVPTEADHVIFDNTSSKNSIIDTAFLGTVQSVTINYDYAGVITQQRNFIVTNDFTQNGATFDSNPTYTFSVGGSFFVADNQISNGVVNVIRADGNGNIYVGGTFLNVSNLPIKYLAKWNGKKWSSVGDPLDGPVAAMAIDTSNNVYVGGTFKNAGALAVNGIAKWGGSSWSALDGGVTEGSGGTAIAGEVKVIEIDSANQVYIGGSFEHAGSVQYANHFARWNGSSWARFDYGVGTTNYSGGDGNTYLKGYVNHIIVRDNPDPGATDKDIYLGGSFTNICGNDACSSGNTTGNYLAKYNGLAGTLSTYGNGTMTAAVSAMTFDASDHLVVSSISGIRQTSNGATKSIGYFDGSSWFGYTTFNGSINKLIKIGNDIYVGGLYPSYPPNNNISNFTVAIPDYYNQASSLGYGVDGEVYDIQSIGGSIYATGAFKGACTGVSCTSSTQTSAIVKYDPASAMATRLASPFRKASFLRYTGAGTSGSPYQISDVYGLQAAVSLDTKYLALANDIDAAASDNWNNGSDFLPLSSELKPFKGSFNGNNHSISNLKISNFSQDAGLFGVLDKGSTASNVTISGATIASTIFIKNAGVFVGKNNGIISGITVSGNVNISSPPSSPGSSVGGAVGFDTNKDYGTDNIAITSMTNITTDVAIVGANISDVGGVLGTQEKIPQKLSGYPYYKVASTIILTLSNLTSTGAISISNTLGRIGGVVGRQDYEFATISGSSSSSIITVTIDSGTGLSDGAVEYIGGLAGYSFGVITSSYATGSITSTIGIIDIDQNFVGGLVGKADKLDALSSNIASSYASGDITLVQSDGLINSVGGLAGASSVGNIASSNSSSDIDIDSSGEVKNVGGLIGQGFNGDISTSYASGAINIDNHLATNQLASGGFGGLAGLSTNQSITSSYSSGLVTISADDSCADVGGIGGLVGIFSGTIGDAITTSYSRSAVTANCIKVGGLVGVSSQQIDQSFATGSVSGLALVGGFVGYAAGVQGIISNSFATGNVATTANVNAAPLGGGFVGLSKSTDINFSYSLGAVSGNGPNGGFAGGYDQRDADFSADFYLKNGTYNSGLSDVGAQLVDGYGGDVANLDQNLSGKILGASKVILRDQYNYSAWDLSTIWGISDHISYPYLRVFDDFASLSTTQAATDVSADSTTLNGNITQINTYKPYIRGFLYGIDVDNLDFVSTDGSSDGWNGDFGTGAFSAALTNLPVGLYNYRTFASSIGGTSLGAVQQFEIVVSGYTVNTYNIISSAGANGNISPLGTNVITEGQDKTFFITPDSNYHIKDVLADSVSEGAIANYTFSNIVAAHTISATFEIDIPSAVSNIGFVNLNSNSFDLTWDDNSITEDGFKIYIAKTDADCGTDSTYNGISPLESAQNSTSMGSYSYASADINSRYCAKIVAYNATGSAAAVYSSAKYTLANIPSIAITNSGYNATDGFFADVTISANLNPDATQYLVKYSNAAQGEYLDITNHSLGTSKSFKISQSDVDFAGNTAYWFKVLAYNGDTIPVLTDFSSPVTFVTPPAAPATIDVTGNCFGKALVTWSGAVGADKYSLSYGTDAEATNIDTINNIVPTSYELLDLDYGTDYYVKVSSTSTQNGAGPYTTPNLNFRSYDCSGYITPTGFYAAEGEVTESSITWRWTDNATGEDGYKIENNIDNLISPLLGANINLWQETALSPNQGLTRHVRVWNNLGNSQSNEATVYTKAHVPTAPTLTSISSGSLRLKINADSNPTYTHYLIKETTTNKYVRESDGALVSDPDWQVASIWNKQDGNGIAVTGLTPNTAYVFSVQAANEAAIRFNVDHNVLNITTNFSDPASLTTKDRFTISVGSTKNGTITPSGFVFVDANSDQEFTIRPNRYYHIEDVVVDGVSTSAVKTYSFKNVITNHTLSAVFAANPTSSVATAEAVSDTSVSAEVSDNTASVAVENPKDADTETVPNVAPAKNKEGLPKTVIVIISAISGVSIIGFSIRMLMIGKANL